MPRAVAQRFALGAALLAAARPPRSRARIPRTSAVDRLCRRRRRTAAAEIADAVAVDREAERHLGRHLVAFGDRDLAHVVAEARELRALPVVPRRAPRAPRRRRDPAPRGRSSGRRRPCARSRMRVWMNPASRSPCAAWFRFMKSMSMRSHGRSRLNCVCRWHERLLQRASVRRSTSSTARTCASTGSGRRSSASPLAASSVARISSGVVSRALKTTGSGTCFDPSSALATVARVGGDRLERARAVEVLRAADEPDRRCGEQVHRESTVRIWWCSARRGDRCRQG